MKIIFVLIGFFLSGIQFVYAQDPSQCGFIQESNYRSLCRALAEKSSSQCGFITESNLRSMCRAIVEKDSSQCGFINNNDQRAMCRALTVSR